MTIEIKIGNIKIGGKNPFVLIAGPCVIETKEIVFKIAEQLKKITKELKIPLVFKASYDKANRSSIKSYRGPGIYKGLEILADIKEKFDIDNINLIKPGVGETTRVLLRRVPWKILVNDMKNKNLKHILILAKEKNVPIEVYKDMAFSCCGIIKSKKSFLIN